MSVNIPCLVAVIILYILILIIGIVAARKTNKAKDAEEVMIANRNIGLWLGLFTLTASNICGGYINGTAEYAAFYGLLQTQAPVGYCIGIVLSGLFMAPKMRREKYVTLFDPFQLKYGRKMGALLIIPHMVGELFWSASVLAALGGTISIIVDIDPTISIIVSSLIAIVYTFLGGLYAVAYTDVIQMVLIVIGLVLACPFAVTSEHVHFENITTSAWLGEVGAGTELAYLDTLLLLSFGGTTWQPLYQRGLLVHVSASISASLYISEFCLFIFQPLYQRVLASKNIRVAVLSCYGAAVISLVLAIPPMVLGYAGAAADWNSTTYEGPLPIPDDRKSYILPMTLNYLVPLPVSIIGMSAICAAVMSSADSCFLSSSTIFAKNIYKDILRRKATDRELMWVLRVCIILFGVLGTLVAVFATTIYGLFVLACDLMYVVLFPQLVCVLWVPWANTYGSFAGFLVSFLLRILSGDAVLQIPAAIKFPLYDYSTDSQLFPFRTLAMLSGLFCILVFSGLTHVLFTRGHLDVRYDVFKCHRKRTHQKKDLAEMDVSSNLKEELINAVKS
ncbi:high-affinity choline transporter 1-like [Physella acuta]|uniref:high-affinity choline transporter 1-like n=1 Tax=Physella acuta TaxID=109671 RepID=UPI0027DAF319|nr:high-affinity choline transporter 1-like [Physella acuta]